jgi:hypothetical protein
MTAAAESDWRAHTSAIGVATKNEGRWTKRKYAGNYRASANVKEGAHSIGQSVRWAPNNDIYDHHQDCAAGRGGNRAGR